MLPRYRQRRGPYALAEPSPAGGVLRRLITLAVLIFIVYLLAKWILSALGVGNHLDRRTVLLDVEQRSNVTVSLEGGLMQRADGQLKLWPEDRIVANANGHARLAFFDGTIMRMDEQSEVTITDTSKGTKTSTIGAELARGALWVSTPDAASFSGTIVRVIKTENYTATIPSDADVVFGGHSILVFSADGDGVEVQASGADAVFIGEGQQMSVPEDEKFLGDLRRYRSAMDPLTVRRAFIEESRSLPGLSPQNPSSSVPATDSIDLISINSPQDGQTVSGSTVRVQGQVGPRVERVRVNGYPATINRDQGTYSQELAMPTTETFTIRVEALDRTGVVVQQEERTVKPGIAATLAAPTITKPGKAGETVHTATEELELKGTAPMGTAAIYVNDYKLLLFRTGDTDWSYLASTRLTNLKQGENVFSVVGEDAAGHRSVPAVLTIVLGEAGPTTPAAGTSSSVAPTVAETSLPQNAPLKPGTIAVTAPTPGASASFTGTGFLLEGTTVAETASVWVNGYQLKLYTPGKSFWNYWATAAYGTLKPGTNLYRIVTRNKDNQILDSFTYTVEYTK